MKQHITSDQYQELSDDAKLKLVGWVTSWTKVTDPITTIYQDMTIGRMIEFLVDNEYAFEIASDLGKTWVYKFIGYENRKEVKGEVCYALWKLVKEVLEEENK
jgi:hypothetical protein